LEHLKTKREIRYLTNTSLYVDQEPQAAPSLQLKFTSREKTKWNIFFFSTIIEKNQGPDHIYSANNGPLQAQPYQLYFSFLALNNLFGFTCKQVPFSNASLFLRTPIQTYYLGLATRYALPNIYKLLSMVTTKRNPKWWFWVSPE
jgi:hypothetical protein